MILIEWGGWAGVRAILVLDLEGDEFLLVRPTPSRSIAVGIVLIALALQGVALAAAAPTYFVDDAGFFFRYAEHLTQGLGYRFNPNEPPVWGASAPLWPLVLSVGMRAGLAVDDSARIAAVVLTLAAVGLLTMTAMRVAGVLAALLVALLLALDFRFGFWAMSGMESPLGHFAIALGLFAIASGRVGVMLGVAMGLALVHKLDFVPFAFLLLAAAWLDTRRVSWIAISIAAGCAIAWYGFAWVHFGSVVPNSFLIKTWSSHPPVPVGWFVSMALVSGIRLPLSLLAIFGAATSWSARRGLVFCATGLVAVHAIAYTLVRPVEPWDWYGAPLQGPLCLLAALGLTHAWQWTSRGLPGQRARVAGAALLIGAVAALGLRLEQPAYYQRVGTNASEGCRVAAGRWVAANTPAHWQVLSHFGNPLYYAHRFALDTTRLNRAIGPTDRAEMLRTYTPEVWIDFLSADITPWEAFKPDPRYRVAHVIKDHTDRQSFYSVVLVRKDLPVLADEQAIEVPSGS